MGFHLFFLFFGGADFDIRDRRTGGVGDGLGIEEDAKPHSHALPRSGRVARFERHPVAVESCRTCIDNVSDWPATRRPPAARARRDTRCARATRPRSAEVMRAGGKVIIQRLAEIEGLRVDFLAGRSRGSQGGHGPRRRPRRRRAHELVQHRARTNVLAHLFDQHRERFRAALARCPRQSARGGVRSWYEASPRQRATICVPSVIAGVVPVSGEGSRREGGESLR